MVKGVSLRSARGQMSIFVVLIFHVLFVLFSMSINIGLVVHDKINLQNAVDLGAYYAAAKQAEMLSAMAHQNYQIRQAYKLLAWRYNVLGGVGTQPGQQYPGSRGRSTRAQPTVTCVQEEKFWKRSDIFVGKDSMCDDNRYKRIPNLDFTDQLQRAARLAPWSPVGWLVLKQATEELKLARETCQGYGAMNWLFNMVALTSYRWQQAQRRALIRALENNMRRPIQDEGGFVDIDGGSVYEGVKNTIERNLTHANLASGPEIRVFNSLNSETPLLSPITVWLNASYLHISNDCANKTPRHISVEPDNMNLVRKLNLEQLVQFSNFEEDDSRWGMSLGVEKNPWLMVYVGVKASTKPRQLFWPLGQPVQMTARAFAKPFGGRMGPWYGRAWPAGAGQSNRSTRFENLFPAQRGGDPAPIHYTPRAPRYPGDARGAHWQRNLLSYFDRQRFKFQASHLEYFSLINDAWAQTKVELDALVWGPPDVNSRHPSSDYPRASGIARLYELRAVAPDLFDIAYYSIEPNSWPTYQAKIKKNKPALGVPDDVPVLHDLGYRDPKLWEPRNNSVWSKLDFGVKDQIAITKLYKANPIQKQNEYMISNWQHVLTNWAHPHAKDGRFNDVNDRFAACSLHDSVRPQGVQSVPSHCIMGGRSGYSVKLVSRALLYSNQLALGGDDSQGPIQNPPPEGF